METWICGVYDGKNYGHIHAIGTEKHCLSLYKTMKKTADHNGENPNNLFMTKTTKENAELFLKDKQYFIEWIKKNFKT
jgi:hypothetical protein